MVWLSSPKYELKVIQMTKYEELIEKYKHLIIEERPMKSAGLYADGCIWIDRSMTNDKKYCVLAEELGHYHTSAGNILDQEDTGNRKQEYKARKWAYETILPVENILFALADGHGEIWDMAEYLEVDEAFLRDALRHYHFIDV